MEQCRQYQTELEATAAELGAAMKTRLKGLTETFEQRADALKEEAPDPSTIEAVVNIEFDVEWSDQEILFDLPEFTMKTQEWVLDLPQVTMRDRVMIFHTPSVRMVRKKVGQYPEIHGFTIKWKDIYIDVPEPFMEEQRIVMGIPEFTMAPTSMKLDIPEVTMRTQRIVLGLPQVRLRSVSGTARAVGEKAEALQQEANDAIARARGEVAREGSVGIAKRANSLFSCLRTGIQMKKDETLAMLEPAIVMMQQSITKLNGIKADEARAKAADLQRQLAEVTQRRAAIETRFAEAIAKLIDEERNVVEKLTGQLAAA